MNGKYPTISTALVFMFAVVVGTAEAKTMKLHCTFSGTFANGVETNIDTNDDGASATLAQGVTNCSPGGTFLFQNESEWIPQPTVTTCPVGTTNEFHIDETTGQYRDVLIAEKTGDQIFSRIASGTLCINFSIFPFQFTDSGHSEVIGGTGKFTGATGTYDFQASGSYLQFGFKNGVFGGFGQFTGTEDGTLNLPNAGDDNKE